MNTTAAGFLIPIGVIAYTMAGGLKATFLASYIHTAIIFGILITFIYVVYAGASDKGLGSPSKVYDLLARASPLVTPPALSALSVSPKTKTAVRSTRTKKVPT